MENSPKCLHAGSTCHARGSKHLQQSALPLELHPAPHYTLCSVGRDVSYPRAAQSNLNICSYAQNQANPPHQLHASLDDDTLSPNLVLYETNHLTLIIDWFRRFVGLAGSNLDPSLILNNFLSLTIQKCAAMKVFSAVEYNLLYNIYINIYICQWRPVQVDNMSIGFSNAHACKAFQHITLHSGGAYY